MPAGRPPKPTEQKRRLGNPGGRPLPEPVSAIVPAPDQVPAPPRGLRRVGREVWIRLWSVGYAWLSRQTDWDLMVRLCQAHDERAQLMKVIRVSRMTDDLETLALVLDEREDGDDEEPEPDAGAVIRLLFKRIRSLEERLEQRDGAVAGEQAKPAAKRKRGRAPLTGYFSLGSTGQLVLHPAVRSLRVLEGEIRRLESLCGFNPSDRSRLGLAEVKKVSKLEELLERRARRRQQEDEGEEDED